MFRLRFTPNARALLPGAGAAAVGGAMLAALACIPDLPDNPAAGVADADGSGADVSADESLVPPGCGDGFIDLAAGEQCDPGPTGGGAAAGCNPDCTMQCPASAGFVWAKNDHCYELAPAPASSLILGADRAACGALPGGRYVHVATFASEEEFDEVARNVDAGWFWVGLSENRDIDDYVSIYDFEPGWSAPCTGCYLHNANPGAALPLGSQGAAGGAYCVQASSDLRQQAWQKIPCSGIDPGIHVVCEREPVGSHARLCDAGLCFDLVWTYGKKTYVYGSEPLPADGAEQACSALGGRLIVLRSRDEREQLWKELANLSVVPTSVWIGLSGGTASGAVDAGNGADAGAPDAAPGGGSSNVWTWDDDASADAYPSPWGWARPHTGGDASTRAYLYSEQPQASDNTLARNDGPMVLPYVCEIDVVDAGER